MAGRALVLLGLVTSETTIHCGTAGGAVASVVSNVIVARRARHSRALQMGGVRDPYLVDVVLVVALLVGDDVPMAVHALDANVA
jgi:hypothetical protein